MVRFKKAAANSRGSTEVSHATFLVRRGRGRSSGGPAAAGETTCGYGTKIDFLDNPKEAAKLAKKQEKLVMVLHVSGYFEDPGLT